MSKQLYEEAIADLKKVKEIAEDKAKRAVVEAVAPRIRELIEKELLAEAVEDLEVEEEEVVNRCGDKGEKLIVEPNGKDVEEVKRRTTKKLVVDLAQLAPSAKVESFDASVKNLVSAKMPSSTGQMEQKLRYVEKMVEALAKVDSRITESAEFDSNVSHLGDMIDVIYEFIDKKIDDPTTRLGYGLKVRKCLEKLEKLQETTMKRRLNEDKVTIELDLPGVDLGEVLDDASVDLVLDGEGEEEEGAEGEEPDEGEEGEEEASKAGAVPGEEGEPEKEEGLLEVLGLDDDAVVEIDENMLRREIAFMKLLREADESESGALEVGERPGPEEFDDFGGAEEEGEPLDMDLTEASCGMDEEMYGMDEIDAMAKVEAYLDELTMTDETDKAGGDEGTSAAAAKAPKKKMEAKQCLDEDDLLEVDVDEIVSMGQAKDNDEHNTKDKNVQKRQPANESVRLQMAKELKLQESLRLRASQLKKLYAATKDATTLVEARQAASRAAQLKAAYAEAAKRYNASVSRFNKLSQSLSEGSVLRADSNSGAKSAASTDQLEMLSKKLAETNLFNAKLLFTNKLLQNESLTSRQKSQVIEQLDAAETIREAKLVYESLAKTLVKPRKNVTESRVIGSSSQITRPASTQTLNEGVEAERWARLAGIK